MKSILKSQKLKRRERFSVGVLLVIALITNGRCGIVLNKCCQKGMIFEKGLKCVKFSREKAADDFDWFPMTSVVDGRTLKAEKHRRDFHTKILGKAFVNFGKKPDCDMHEIDSTSYSEEKPLFNFLLYNESLMEVYVSSNKTLHHFSNAYQFRVAERDENAASANTNSVRLRTFPLSSVCVDAILDTNRHRLLICPCRSRPCIRKCCKDEQYFNVTSQMCEAMTSATWDPIRSWRPNNIEDRPLINKCCPKGQRFDINLKCVSQEEETRHDGDEEGHGQGEGEDEHKAKFAEINGNGDLFSWFPLSSVVNSTTLKIHEHHREIYVNLLNHNFGVNYEGMPNCSSEETKQVAYFKKDIIEFYHYILYENKTMRIHISKPGSMHSAANAVWHFPTVQRDAEVLPIPSKSIDFLRTFPLENACVDLGFENIHFLVYCPCRTMVCVRKCCSDGQFYNATSDECQSNHDLIISDGNWRPRGNGIVDQYYLLSDTFPSCENPLLLKVPDHAYTSCNRFNKDSDNDFTIFKNGSIKVNKYRNLYESDQYCGEVTWHDGGKIYDQNLILCSALKNESDHLKPIKSIIYGTLLVLGGICLLITVSISLYLPELRRRMHNKIALSHNASLMVAYFTWGVGQLSPNLGDRSCMFIALIIQFSFLGSFFWLNVMCIDISMTFSATRSLGSHVNVGPYKTFVYYCIYSWGSTAIISAITMIMEFLPNVSYDFLRPGFACSCGFNTANASILIYFYGPMSILLIFNLILFVFTTTKIMSVQRTTAILHKTDSTKTGGSSYQTDKQRYDLIQWLILYAKLFLLMGLTWITEIISWAVGGPDYYWYFSDILNLLRAVFIFALFICKRSVLESLRRQVKKKWMPSNREGCSKSLSDVISTSTSLRDSRFRSSTNSRKQNDSTKAEIEVKKLILKKSDFDERDSSKSGGRIEESFM